MQRKCKFSIVVPVYNAEKTLERCVDSIIAQSFTDWELLLVDDGSTDTSGSLCDDFSNKDGRIRSFHKQNGGPSSARNLALDFAVGDYICFCDSDDWVGKDWLRNFSRGEGYDLIISGFLARNWNGSESDTRVVSESFSGKMPDEAGKLFTMMNDSKNVGYLWCRCFRRDIIKQNKLYFDDRFRILEDECFIFEYMSNISSYIVISSFEYHYMVPDFNSKYDKLDARGIIDCVKRILMAEKRILGTYNHPIVLQLVHRYVDCLKVLCKNKKSVRAEIDWIKSVYFSMDAVNRGPCSFFFKMNYFTGPYTDLMNQIFWGVLKF